MHPMRERLAGQLMLALYRSGRQAEALDAYHRLAKRLSGDLGLYPSGEITRLHEAILRHDQSLELPANAATGEADRAFSDDDPERPAVTPDGNARRLRTAAPAPAQLPRDVPGFAGRAAELSQLHALLPDASPHSGAASGRADGEMVVISAIGGTGGVGKTALAVHFARQVADQFPDGQLYANLRGFDPSAEPAPAAEVLAGFLTALGAAPDTIPGGLDAQSGLFRSLLNGKRMLLLLDNARDENQVRPLLPGSGGCMVIVTSRSQLTGLAVAEGACSLTLDVLAPDEARDLLARRLGAGRLARTSPRQPRPAWPRSRRWTHAACWPTSPGHTSSSSMCRAGTPSTTCSAPMPPSSRATSTAPPSAARPPVACSITTCTPRTLRAGQRVRAAG
jgi:hypothetical protein